MELFSCNVKLGIFCRTDEIPQVSKKDGACKHPITISPIDVYFINSRQSCYGAFSESSFMIVKINCGFR